VALARFDTPFVVDALVRGLTDPSPPVRVQAVNGLASRRNPRAASALLQAIDGETDIEVQLAMIAALGRLATPDAVVKLTLAAAPDGRIFRRKSPAHRVAAAQALAMAGTPGAMSALQALLNDKEKEVRDAVFRAMLPGARRGEPAAV
jgi:HEAT repeat protein